MSFPSITEGLKVQLQAHLVNKQTKELQELHIFIDTCILLHIQRVRRCSLSPFVSPQGSKSAGKSIKSEADRSSDWRAPRTFWIVEKLKARVANTNSFRNGPEFITRSGKQTNLRKHVRWTKTSKSFSARFFFQHFRRSLPLLLPFSLSLSQSH